VVNGDAGFQHPYPARLTIPMLKEIENNKEQFNHQKQEKRHKGVKK
jgi:hypothetical protein